MNAEEKREQRLKLVEDQIGRAITDSERSGELRAARGFGKPLDFGDGYDETPAELRMAMKVLRDAGVAPAEVQLMQEIACLKAEVDAMADQSAAHTLRQRLSEKRQALALRLEKLRRSGAL